MTGEPTTHIQQSLRDTMSFRKEWLVYQSRLLEHLDRNLANRRLHLVAAPGSGKTVIGLEVIRRINQPTLVLAPTITIRDQWVDRLVDLFLPPGVGRPAWVSTELKKPAFLTVATYQALHSVYSGRPEEQTATDSDENGVSKDHFEMHADGENGSVTRNFAVQWIPRFPSPNWCKRMTSARIRTLCTSARQPPRSRR